MTGRVVRLELRRSAAFWAGVISLPMVALAAGVTAQGMSVVLGDARQELALLIPLALGLGAWQARRDRRSRTTELLSTTARPGHERFLHTAAALGMGTLAGSLLVFAGLTTYGLIAGAYVPVHTVVTAVTTALYLVAAVWLGAAVGRALPSALTPPLLAVAGLVVLTALAIVTDPEGSPDGRYPALGLLVPASGGGFGTFDKLTGSAMTAQVTWAIGLAVAGLALYAATTRQHRLVGVAAAALGLAVAGTLLPQYLHQAVAVDRGSIALVCTQDEPEVCVRRVHAGTLDTLRDPGRAALEALAAKLPDPPVRVVETYLTGDPEAPPAEPDAETLPAEFVDAGPNLRWTLLLGAGTPFCGDAATETGIERYDATRIVTAAWLLDEPPLEPSHPDDEWGWLPSTSVTHPAYDELRALPAAEQQARVAAYRTAELACEPGDRWDLLFGDDAPR